MKKINAMKKCSLMTVLLAVFFAVTLCGCNNSSSDKKDDPLSKALNSSNHEVTGKLNEHPINDPFDQPAK